MVGLLAYRKRNLRHINGITEKNGHWAGETYIFHDAALIDQLAAVNAYADYLQGAYLASDGGAFPARNREGVALRKAALAVLDAAQDWLELSHTDDKHFVLQAPDGSNVAYSYEGGVERLTLLTAESAIEDTTMDFTARINQQFAALGLDNLDAYDIADLGGYIVITDTQTIAVYRSAEGVSRWLATLETQEEVTLDDMYHAIHPNLVEGVPVRYDAGYWHQDFSVADDTHPSPEQSPMTDDRAFTAPGITGYLCTVCAECIEDVEEATGIEGKVLCDICEKDLVPGWADLDDDLKDNLLTWYNHPTVDADDKARLLALVDSGCFIAYACGHCGEQVLRGEPEDWAQFQGVCQGEGAGELCGECVALCTTLIALRGY